MVWVFIYEAVVNLNMIDNTLIVVTTDHGHAIGDNNYMGKRGYPSSPESFNIPIFLRHPDDELGRGKYSNILVQHTDITATILDIIGIKKIDYDERPLYIGMNEMRHNPKPENSEMHGRSFFKTLLDNKEKFRDYVTVGWGSAITVITDNWWFNSRVNGKGVFLYDLKSRDPFGKNVAEDSIDVVNELYNLALRDAGGTFPDYLIEFADNEEDAPGCSELVART